jgi:hypothetical protein
MRPSSVPAYSRPSGPICKPVNPAPVLPCAVGSATFRNATLWSSAPPELVEVPVVKVDVNGVIVVPLMSFTPAVTANV